MSHIDVKRATKNSIILYLRVIVSMVITLWVTRIVLRALGVEDYGIYNVVGGFVVLLGVLSNSLSAAISRYITFELGKADFDRLKKIFSTSLVIQTIIAGIVIIIAESIGLWFLNFKMNIPVTQLTAANWVYQFSVVAFAVDLISVPYNAVIIAHERMKVFAYVGILTAFAKLLIALSLSMFAGHLRLICYSGLLLVVSLSIRVFYGTYCSHNFDETRGKTKIEKPLFKEIFGFAGWNFIGAIAGVLQRQGVNIILNLFFGPVVNASRGIAIQVSGAATTFANNFMTAINPQITKSFGSGEVSESIALSYFGSRMGYYLMFVVALPIIWETPYILNLWLSEVPEYSVIFVRLILINALIDVLSSTLMTIMLATGDIRNYQIIVGGCNMLVLPIAYVFLRFHYPPQSTIVVGIIMSCFALMFRLILLRKMTALSIRTFVKNVAIRIMTVSVVSIIIAYIFSRLTMYIVAPFQNLIMCMLCVLIAILVICTCGLSRVERDKVRSLILQRIHR